MAFEMMTQGRVRDVIQSYESFGLVLPFEAKSLVYSMMNSVPSRRPTLEEVLYHPFLQEEAEKA